MRKSKILIKYKLILRECDGGVICKTNPDPLPLFQSFQLCFAFDFFNLLLIRFHQAGIIIVKHLIQKRNNKVRLAITDVLSALLRTVNPGLTHSRL